MAIALEGSVAPATWSPLRIATDRCKGCELCVDACPTGVLALDTSVVNALGYHPVRLTDAAACTSCALLRPGLPGRGLHRLRPARRHAETEPIADVEPPASRRRS